MIPLIYIVIFTVTTIITLYLYTSRNYNYWKLRNIPFVKPIPFFGNALSVYTIQQSVGDLVHTIYNSHDEPVIGFFICDEPALVVKDLDLVKSILVKDFEYFLNRTMTDNPKDDPVGTHILFVIKSPDWRELRRKITPAFSTRKMRQMYKLMLATGKDLQKYLDSFVKKNPVIETREVCAKYTTELITSIAFGLEADCFNNENDPFRVASRRIFNFDSLSRGIQATSYFVAPSLVRIFGFQFLDGYATSFLKEVFWKTIHQREEKGNTRNDLIDILIEMKQQEHIDDPYKLEGDKLVAQAAQFFIAGYETTSSTISFALYEMAVNPEIQEKLRCEILRFKTEKGEFTYDTLSEMKYLEMCVKETLRKYPIVPFLDRRCTTRYNVPGHDLVLEVGTPVFIPTLGLHYDPRYYPDPDRFLPDRFTDEIINTRPHYTYLPFGEGPRNCIGARFGMLSAKSGLAHILAKYKVDVCDKTQKKMRCNPNGFLLAPIKGLRLRFEKLNL